MKPITKALTASIMAVIVIVFIFLFMINDSEDIYGGVHVVPCSEKYNNAEIVAFDSQDKVVGISNLKINMVNGSICVYEFKFLNVPDDDFYSIELHGNKLRFTEDQVEEGIILFVSE